MNLELELAEYSAWMRRGFGGENCPQCGRLRRTNGPQPSVDGADGAGALGSQGREANGVQILRVSVAYDEARLQHPVQKYFELLKVIFGLVGVGIHLLRKANP